MNLARFFTLGVIPFHNNENYFKTNGQILDNESQIYGVKCILGTTLNIRTFTDQEILDNDLTSKYII